MARTPFKLRSSPAKGLKEFFQGLGRKGTQERQDKQRETNEGGLTNFEKRQADRATQRKTGESKFKTDVRKGREARKADKPGTGDLKKEIIDKSDLTTNQTFKQAFAVARKAGKKEFTWKGNPYTTKLKK